MEDTTPVVAADDTTKEATEVKPVATDAAPEATEPKTAA